MGPSVPKVYRNRAHKSAIPCPISGLEQKSGTYTKDGPLNIRAALERRNVDTTSTLGHRQMEGGVPDLLGGKGAAFGLVCCPLASAGQAAQVVVAMADVEGANLPEAGEVCSLGLENCCGDLGFESCCGEKGRGR